MKDHTHARLAAICLPLALVFALQGGSCGGGNKGVANANATVNRNVGADENRAAEGNSTMNSGANATAGPALGSWGGDHIRLVVKADGADVEFDCAHGRMGKIVTDGRGNFDVEGVFVQERGGPVHVDEKEQSQRARYKGRVEGKTMTLSFFLTDSDEEQEHVIYKLTHGREAELTKCL